MTDEVSPPTPKPAPAPPPAAPAIPPEAVKEISQVITEGLQETLTAPEPVTPPSTEPEVPEIAVPESPKTETPAAPPPPPPASSAPPPPKPSAGSHMRQVVQSRKHARLEKIMEMATQKRVIVNDDVEKLLKVSDATATRYLSELVKTGRLKSLGAKFHEHYEPLGGSNSAI